MFQGKYNASEAVLRMKYKSKSGFNDPVAYRINKKIHCVDKKHWTIYPTYDFCHPICDSLEGIGLSLCSEEFSSHRELYEWLLKELDLPVPDQREFPRLKFPHNITSKRGVAQIRDAITGDDDPRLLTVAGLRRRGIPASVIKSFVCAPSDELQLNHLHDLTRQHCNLLSPRRIAVINPLKCHVNNFEEFKEQRLAYEDAMLDSVGDIVLSVPDHPMRPDENHRDFILREDFFINRFDFVNTNEATQHYLSLSSAVHLRYASTLMSIKSVRVNSDGIVDLLEVNLEATAKRAKKIKVITWLSDTHPATLSIFDNILANAEPNDEEPLSKQINPRSWMKCPI
jgi:glutaminyl-tRNA synthetase